MLCIVMPLDLIQSLFYPHCSTKQQVFVSISSRVDQGGDIDRKDIITPDECWVENKEITKVNVSKGTSKKKGGEHYGTLSCAARKKPAKR